EAGAAMLKYELATEPELAHDTSAYQELVSRIREIVDAKLPVECTVAVVSKGDYELLNLHGRRVWHLPRDDAGNYTGHHPGDSADAIWHLEVARAKGADYLLVPKTSFWWLDH